MIITIQTFWEPPWMCIKNSSSAINIKQNSDTNNKYYAPTQHFFFFLFKDQNWGGGGRGGRVGRKQQHMQPHNMGQKWRVGRINKNGPSTITFKKCNKTVILKRNWQKNSDITILLLLSIDPLWPQVRI